MYPVIDMLRTGKHIKVLCKRNGITVRELQTYMGFACPQTIYRWFAGTALPNVDNLFALSRLLGMSMNEILIERRVHRVDYAERFRMRMLKSRYRRLVCYYMGRYTRMAA